MIGSEIYSRQYPSLAELESFSTGRLQQLVQALEDDVGALEEETRIFTSYLGALRDSDLTHGGTGGGGGGDDDREFADVAAMGDAPGGGKRRGRMQRRKSSDPKELFLSLEDKHAVLAEEQRRLKEERDRSQRQADDARDLLHATMEEATNRVKEVRLEMQYFAREVLDARPDQNPTSVSASDASIDKIVKYLLDRPETKRQHAKKLREKCGVLQQQIVKNTKSLKEKNDGGETFQMIELDQLKIENHQFVERIEQKNLELVDLKGTTTRTVQALNRHMDKLGALLSEQQQLQKEVQSREDFQRRLRTEMEQVQRDGLTARRKNEALKIQHEAVRVPKVEDYIAQKAELLELEKAAQNWKRKVEIAAGHVAVMKQQMLSISKKQKTIISSAAGSQGRPSATSSSQGAGAAASRRN